MLKLDIPVIWYAFDTVLNPGHTIQINDAKYQGWSYIHRFHWLK